MKFTLTTILIASLTLTSAHAPGHHAHRHYRGRRNDGNQTEGTQVEGRSQSGRMTFYTPSQGACGVTNSESDLVVAIPSSMYGSYPNPNSSPMCQKAVAISCSGKTVKAKVRDRCMGCGGGDIDVSPAVFSQCGNLDLGTMTVSWDVV